ncbi:MAG: hypothetical protein L0Z62_27010 [Gemmataceae bacterium]|nr:hypothetical protein [Gemmataceae bacterium]
MAETINCPFCSQPLEVPGELLGRVVRCPSCGQSFTASGGSAPLRTQRAAPVPEPEMAEDDYDDRPRRRRRRDYAEPHRGVLILVFGILGFVVCGLFGVAAWVMGNADLAKIRSGQMDPEGESMTQAGRICGMIATILMILSLVLVVFWFIALAAMIQNNPPPRFR